MSPQYANLFMAKLGEEFLSSCSVKPLAFFRYIDDLLIIWAGSKDDLLTFHNNFNKFHPTIKLSLNVSKTQIHFLDMTIYIKDNAIQTSIYHKPTGRPAYLRWNSFHPRHTKKSIIYSQALRYIRICSDSKDSGSLRNTFLQLGYHPLVIDEQIHKIHKN
ncbi:unnamed protein product [Ranitomeya imitator]|uniref:Reverse transcriptase domain-containing protein n=1 Tax=Ranitomeya imitator TaxID=111125 RepID=A0ABN9LEJ8_9NEOB|nr:unnamed protein product [Ranitomeya imitator]